MDVKDVQHLKAFAIKQWKAACSNYDGRVVKLLDGSIYFVANGMLIRCHDALTRYGHVLLLSEKDCFAFDVDSLLVAAPLRWISIKQFYWDTVLTGV